MSAQNHNNSFNVLRLVFATLVIVSHGPELIDEDRHRELLTMIFGTYSFGEFAVNSFFILSGYLITASWLATPDFLTYLRKRVLRICPGFLVAVAISVLAFGPLGDANFWANFNATHFLTRLPLLIFDTEGFPGSRAPQLNGALWTIHYEFVCYLLIALVGALGVLKRPKLLGALFIAILTAHIVFLIVDPSVQTKLSGATLSLWNRLGHYTRFFGMFLSGAVLYLIREQITQTKSLLIGSLIALLLLMCNHYSAPIAMALPYALLLYLVGRNDSWASRKIGSVDLSYGIYLYAWPISQLIIQRVTDNVWAVVLLTLMGSALVAVPSWYFVEKPALKYKRLKTSAVPRRQTAS